MSFLPGILVKNWQLKVMALAVAILLWTVPRFEGQNSQVLEDVPVRVQLSDPNWALVGEPSPVTISVTLSGPARDLIAIGVENPPILVPMDEVSSGDTSVLLRPSWFRGSGRDGVVVENLRPGVVNLKFEPIERRMIPFSVLLAGELPPGLSQAGSPTITPSEATVFGPVSLFQRIDELPLEPLDLSTVDGAGAFTQAVDTAAVPGLDVLPLAASVEVPVEPTVTREFTGLELVLPRLESDPQLRGRPSTFTVVLSGAASLVEGVEAEDLTVTIPTGRATLAPGEEVQVGLVVLGCPEWVEPIVTPDWIVLQRPAGQ